MSKKKALLIIWLMCPNIIYMENDVWKPVKVSNVSLSDVSLIKKMVRTSSDILCSMIASRLPWANLFCFNLGGTCLIFNYVAMPYESSTTISDPVDCMTKLDGCIYKGTRIDLGTGDSTTFPQCLTCISGQMVPLPLLPPSGTCDPPFKKVGAYGCFTFGNVTKDYCSSRFFCQSLGGDLWVFPDNQNEEFVIDAATAIGTGTDGPLVGMYGNGTDFFWLDGTLVNKSSDMFRPPFSSTSTVKQDGYCVRVSVTVDHYLIPIRFPEARDVLCQKRTLEQP